MFPSKPNKGPDRTEKKIKRVGSDLGLFGSTAIYLLSLFSQQTCFPFSLTVVHSAKATMPNADKALPRPRGLWKGRGTLLANHALEDKPSPSIGFHNLVADSLAYLDNDSDSFADRCCSGDESDYSSSSSFLRKRRRFASDSPRTSEEEDVQYWDYSRKCGPQDPHRLTKWATTSKLMDTSSVVGPGQPYPDRTSCDLEDWKDLKELFAKAAETYESAFCFAPMIALKKSVELELYLILSQKI